MRDIHLPVPDEFEIPTCSECGEESMAPEVARELDQLMKQILLEELRRHVGTLRARHEVTNQEIEDALGVTRSYLSHLLRGKDTSATLVKLLRCFAEVPGAFEHATGQDQPLARKVLVQR